MGGCIHRGLISHLRTGVLEPLLEWVFPEGCYVCGKVLRWEETALCSHCLVALPQQYPSQLSCLDTWPAASCFAYEDEAKEIIKRIKAKHAPKLTGGLVRRWRRPDWVRGVFVPVPPDPLRRRERGFDPVLEIATQLGREWGMPLDRCLARHHRDVAQKNLNVSQRHEALDGIYFMKRRPKSQGPLILIDDVLTTGATLRHCANVLEEVGFTCGGLLTLADTPSQLRNIGNLRH
jgi:ComF family protein